MRTSTLALIVSFGTALSACSGGSEPADSTGASSAEAEPPAGAAEPQAGAAGPSSEAAEPTSEADLVDRALIGSCAGFDVTKAASMLGVPEAELEVLTSFSERFGGQTCRYWSAESRIGPGIDFLLSPQESSEAAARLLAGQRSVVPAVDAVPPTGPALVEIEGIGDEAFWDTNTGGINVRVRNVVVMIHASTSSEPMSDRDAGQIELERRVAEEVAAGLQR